MVANLGFGLLVITFVVALYSAGAAVYGAIKKSHAWVESARYGMLLTWPLITLSALSIITLLLTNHFEVQYVYAVTSRAMPDVLESHRTVGRAGWLLDLLVLADVGLRLAGHAAQVGARPRVPALGHRGSLVTLAFFLGLAIFCRESRLRAFWQAA